MLRPLAMVVGIVIVSVPVSAALTILLLPFWRWVEEKHAIESVGHSGPADWCYGATFLVCVAALGSLYGLSVRHGKAGAR
jgi:hypothetical protein